MSEAVSSGPFDRKAWFIMVQRHAPGAPWNRHLLCGKASLWEPGLARSTGRANPSAEDFTDSKNRMQEDYDDQIKWQIWWWFNDSVIIKW